MIISKMESLLEILLFNKKEIENDIGLIILFY